MRKFGQDVRKIKNESGVIAKKSHVAGLLAIAMCLTLGSASIAKSVNGDEDVATSTAPDVATMLLTPAEMPLVSDVASSSSAATSSDEASSSANQVAAETSNSTAPAAQSDQIQTYTVQSGDTLSGIAEKFNISVNTIIWANSISTKSTLKEGQSLVILPISGVEYTVQPGDNLQSIADKFKGDVDEIVTFNNLQDSSHVKAGEVILIPDGEQSGNVSDNNTPKPATSNTPATGSAPTPAKTPSTPTTTTGSPSTSASAGAPVAGWLMRPMVGGVKTQGIHGHNAVDLANKLNTPILAAAAGSVIVAKQGGWNGGYGNYVVIDHHNGVQTLYAHMNSLNTSVGSDVTQGQVIGFMGETGDATGVHVHFEVRGAVNPF